MLRLSVAAGTAGVAVAMPAVAVVVSAAVAVAMPAAAVTSGVVALAVEVAVPVAEVEGFKGAEAAARAVESNLAAARAVVPHGAISPAEPPAEFVRDKRR